MREVTLSVGCRLENLSLAGAAARAIAAEIVGAEAAGLVELAVTEIGSNIMRHGHANETAHEYSIAIREEPRELVVEIRDRGPAFAFEPRPMPAVDVDIDDLPEGGFGMPLVHASMDRVEHRRENDVNIITIAKRRPQGNGDSSST